MKTIEESISIFSPELFNTEFSGISKLSVPQGTELIGFIGDYGKKKPIFLGKTVKKEWDDRGEGCWIHTKIDQYGQEWWSRGGRSVWRSGDYESIANFYSAE